MQIIKVKFILKGNFYLPGEYVFQTSTLSVKSGDVLVDNRYSHLMKVVNVFTTNATYNYKEINTSTIIWKKETLLSH